MIIKDKDNNQETIDYLTDLMERELPAEKKRQIERELKMLYSGDKGENSSAYYLDFDFKHSRNWMLIHDLRLEHDGESAQIDHLLIGRLMDVYVIESKNFNFGVSISEEGDFSYFYKNRPYSIPSPIEQNARHIRFLDKFLKDNDLIPKRLGVRLQPNYKNIVLISPNSRLSKPKKGIFDCSPVMKSDRFFERFKSDVNDDTFDSVVSLSKVISVSNLETLAEKISLLHTPASIDYVAKFDLKKLETVENNIAEDKTDYGDAAPICDKCGSEMVKRIAKKGKTEGQAFWGCRRFPKCKNVLSIKNAEASSQFDSDRKPKNNIPEETNSDNTIANGDASNKVVSKKKVAKKSVVKKTVSKKTRTKNTRPEKTRPGETRPGETSTTGKSTSYLASEAPAEKSVPFCPKCNKAMIKRVAKKGDKVGNEFWGCSTYPECDGTISI